MSQSSTLLKDALDHPDMPQLNTWHPFIGGLLLKKRDVNLVNVSTVEVRLVYERPTWITKNDESEPQASITIGSSVQSVPTNKDVNGNLMEVEYDDPREQEYRPNKSDNPQKQTGEASKDVPLSTITYKRIEYENPLKKSQEYVGRLNSGPWAHGAEKTWKCTYLGGPSNDGGASYEVTYTFEYNPDGWDFEAIYTDPETGKPPVDVVPDVGQKTFQILSTANFNALGLE